jgi:hypothetical protein
VSAVEAAMHLDRTAGQGIVVVTAESGRPAGSDAQ